MALEELEQQARPMTAGVLTFAGIFLWLDVMWLLEPGGMNPEDERIRTSAWGVVFVWPIAAAALKLHRWNPARYVDSRTHARIVYTTGLLAALLHASVAFHFGHGWSHAEAFDRTERVSGFGPGVFVNYAFVLVMAAETAWMWRAFDSYISRPRWVHRIAIGFLWFVLFNSTVIFGRWPVNLLGLVMLMMPWLAVRLIMGNVEAEARSQDALG
ncbi:MAG: hypothetical protein U0791_21445 [Gemmataceae bacterium]